MGVESLKLVARHSKTAWRSFLVSSGTASVTLITSPGSITSLDGRGSSFTSHCTVGVGRPAEETKKGSGSVSSSLVNWRVLEVRRGGRGMGKKAGGSNAEDDGSRVVCKGSYS